MDIPSSRPSDPSIHRRANGEQGSVFPRRGARAPLLLSRAPDQQTSLIVNVNGHCVPQHPTPPLHSDRRPLSSRQL
jgi:hypothetical protein